MNNLAGVKFVIRLTENRPNRSSQNPLKIYLQISYKRIIQWSLTVEHILKNFDVIPPNDSVKTPHLHITHIHTQ